MKTIEELEALLEAVTRERDLSLSAWESAGMTGRDAQSAMLELARQLEEARAIVGSCWLTYSEGERDKARAWAHKCERERDEARASAADAYRRGAEEMRLACQEWCIAWESNGEAIADALADLRVEDER